ncbi:hypothetical protein [Embleya sp. NPDC005971]|uniref:hypothetical protein n=1 Tax=Embleya sp. NPDC005971 TaxID=3156724 RepID=UPI0033DAFA10
MILSAGLAVADTEGNGPAQRSGSAHTRTHGPTGEVTTKPPVSTEPPTGTRPPVTTKPATTKPATTEPASTPPPSTHRPTTKPPTTPPPSSTRPPTTTKPPTAAFGVDTDNQITFDANGRSTIWFTVTNNTGQMDPHRDVYAYSTGQLKILSVPGCEPARALTDPGPQWVSSFRCTFEFLEPHETRRWSATVEYPPARSPRAARAEVRLPLAAEPDISTFCVLVVPQDARDTTMVLGRRGPLTLKNVPNNNDPSFIGYTVESPIPGGTTGGGTTGGGTTGGGSTGGDGSTGGGGTTGGGSTGGGDTTGGTTTGASTGGTDQATPPTSLPKTGPDDDTLPLAGGALGLMLVGNALFQGARLRRIRSAEGDDEPARD